MLLEEVVGLKNLSLVRKNSRDLEEDLRVVVQQLVLVRIRMSVRQKRKMVALVVVTYGGNFFSSRAVVVAQLAELSLLAPEMPSLNPNIG